MRKSLVTIILFVIILFNINTVSALNINSKDIKILDSVDYNNYTQVLRGSDDDLKFWGNLDTIKCGNSDLPVMIPSIVRTIVNIIKIATPIVLIIMGMIDMLQATIAEDEKKMTTAKGKFVKRLLSGAIVFLVVTVIQFLVGLVAPEDSDSLLKCVSCMVNDASECGTVTTGSGGTGSGAASPTGTAGGNHNPTNPEKIIYVGDSRTVGMCSAVSLSSDSDCSISKESQGYNWFKNTALSNLKNKINDTNTYYVVINMGTNDLGSSSYASNYATLYNDLAASYPESKIIVVSVTPIQDSKAKSNGYSVTDSMVVSFNSALRNTLSSKITYCDVYSKIKGSYNTTDGIHYTNDTYKKIYNEIKECF